MSKLEKQVLTLSVASLVVILMHMGYSWFEVVRHLFVGSDPKHVVGHAIVGVIFTTILWRIKEFALLIWRATLDKTKPWWKL